jgi:hypothetical protein
MAHTCLVKFNEPTEARVAIRRLLQEGIEPDAMEVMTSQPHHEPFVPHQKPTKLRTWAICGAGLGLLGGLGLATITALNYPLVKGGMPSSLMDVSLSLRNDDARCSVGDAGGPDDCELPNFKTTVRSSVGHGVVLKSRA